MARQDVLYFFSIFVIHSATGSMCSLTSGSSNGRWSLPCLPLYGRKCRFTCYYSVGKPPSAQALASLTLTCDAATRNWLPSPTCPPASTFEQRLNRQTVTTVGRVTPRRPVVPKPVPPPQTTELPPPPTTLPPETTTVSPFCPNLNPPSSGLISGQCVQAIDGDTCTHSCVSNFTLVGPSLVNCSGGLDDAPIWSSEQPKCVPSNCPALPPSDARYIGPTCSTSGGLNGITLCILSCPEVPFPIICWNDNWIPPTPPKCADLKKPDPPKETTATGAGTSPAPPSPPASQPPSPPASQPPSPPASSQAPATASNGSPETQTTAMPKKQSDASPGSPNQIPVCVPAKPV